MAGFLLSVKEQKKKPWHVLDFADVGVKASWHIPVLWADVNTRSNIHCNFGFSFGEDLHAAADAAVLRGRMLWKLDPSECS